MKKILLSFFMLISLMSAQSQEFRVDTIAVMILDRMASIIGELNSCSFTLHTSIDVTDPDYGVLTKFETDKVYLAGPDKMHVDLNGDKGHRGFWYNGQTIVAYSFEENNFAVIEAPGNIIAMIDTVHENYGIEFPAADFFYPTFTDDMLNLFDNLMFLGKKNVDGRECLHILGTNKDMNVQIWYSSDTYTLPMKFIISYKGKENKQYEATFSNWQLNPVIPASAFEFLPPPGARQVSILPKTQQ